MPRELREMTITRVSLVKKPANKRRFLLLKAEETEETDMAGQTKFMAEVERLYTSLVSKGGDIARVTPEQGRAIITYELAKQRPDLYEEHRREMNNRM